MLQRQSRLKQKYQKKDIYKKRQQIIVDLRLTYNNEIIKENV